MKQSIQQLTQQLKKLLKRQEATIQDMKDLSQRVDVLHAEHFHTQITNTSSQSISHE